jgi:hypothetical protein
MPFTRYLPQAARAMTPVSAQEASYNHTGAGEIEDPSVAHVAVSAGGDIALLERGPHQTHRPQGAHLPRFQCLFEPIGEGLPRRRHAPHVFSY